MGSEDRPDNYGATSHGLRGDYRHMRPDYTVEQDYDAYTPEQQDRWRRLYRRQIERVPGRACDAYVEALDGLDYAAGIPRFDVVNEKLARRHRLAAGGGAGAGARTSSSSTTSRTGASR